MLDCCLDVGFKSAASDGCHLLYSTTWSALGASPAWYEVSPSISMNPEDLFHGPLSALLSEIRNDVCLITLKAKRQEGPVSTNPMVDRNMDSASACSFEKKKKYGVDYTLLCNNCTPSFHCSTHDARYRASWEWKGPGAQRWTRSFYFQVAAIQKELHREYPQVKIVTKGNTITWEDVQENLQQTHADGLMSAEGIFDHPALFLQRYGTDPERPVTGLRLSDKMRQLTAKLWTLALKEVITSKVDTYNAKLQKSSSIVVDQVTVTLTACCKPTNSNSPWNISISPPCFQCPSGRPLSIPAASSKNSCRSNVRQPYHVGQDAPVGDQTVDSRARGSEHVRGG